MNYQSNKKYFKESGSIKVPVIIGAIGLLMLGSGAPLPGIIAIAIAGGWIYMIFGGRPTDAAIDADIAAGVANLIPKAMAKLGVDAEQVRVLAPVTFTGPENGPVGVSPAMFRLGKDGGLRSSNQEAVVLLFSETQVFSYTLKFSITEPAQMELTDEYFYKDISSVATGSENFSWSSSKGSKSIQMETFKLTVAGAAMEVALYNSSVAAQSIQGMKQLIREKKNA